MTRGAIPAALRADMLVWVGCLAGALDETDYAAKLAAAGFTAISVTPTRVCRVEDARDLLVGRGHDVDALAEQVDGRFFGAFVRAGKPTTAGSAAAPAAGRAPTCCGG